MNAARKNQRLGLRDIGYDEGRNLAIDYRWAETIWSGLPPGSEADI
jgi:hypothetical protein